ncbi:MAG: hypothetical protein IT381_13790 [Deltaproteobacteria bacterium]|nr:hypothetical protein [Deltaproteobacteria bacterium]
MTRIGGKDGTTLPPTVADVATPAPVAKTNASEPPPAPDHLSAPTGARPPSSAAPAHTAGPDAVVSGPRALADIAARLAASPSKGTPSAVLPPLSDVGAAPLGVEAMGRARALLAAPPTRFAGMPPDKREDIETFRRAWHAMFGALNQNPLVAAGVSESAAVAAQLTLIEVVAPLLARGDIQALAPADLATLTTALQKLRAGLVDVEPLIQLITTECAPEREADIQRWLGLQLETSDVAVLEATRTASHAGESKAVAGARALAASRDVGAAIDVVGSSALLGLRRAVAENPAETLISGIEQWTRLTIGAELDVGWREAGGGLAPIMLHFAPGPPLVGVDLSPVDGSGFDRAFESFKDMPVAKAHALCRALELKVLGTLTSLAEGRRGAGPLAGLAPGGYDAGERALRGLGVKIEGWLARFALPPPPPGLTSADQSRLDTLVRERTTAAKNLRASLDERSRLHDALGAILRG